jgi:CheY-like chemotaxis protein
MAGERILLVEDNPHNRRLAQFLLQAHGYVIYEATTGEEALALARAHQPALILMDLQLPGMDGYAVTRCLKEDAATAAITVVALTAYAMPGDRDKALAAGCDGYIPKPIDTKEFPTAVQRYLGAPRKQGGV